MTTIHIDAAALTELRELAAARLQALDTADGLDEQGQHNQASRHHDKAENLDRELAAALIDLLDLEADPAPAGGFMAISEDVANAFTTAFGFYTADDVGVRFSCTEIDALAELLIALGHADLADAWVDAHARDDDEGDAHYRGA
ncbi:hypothetical protein [Nonomuraea sp. NPDC049750]|uniref:hypothetical protein n=1 Tax=Nonomuraea sp. NPDC049750 TaxID=3154738 RepID=UPI0033F18692